MVRLAAVGISLAALFGAAAPAAADGADVRKAKDAITSAERKADDLADQVDAAETAAARLAGQVDAARRELASVEERTRAAMAAIRSAAIADYTGRGVQRMSSNDPALEARRGAYEAVARGAAVDDLDAFKAALGDLGDARSRLDVALAAQRKQGGALTAKQAALLGQLGRLDAALSSAKGQAAQEAAAASRVRRAAKPGGTGGVVVGGGGAWRCPVAGPHSFTNDWGNPRYGGGYHTHKGTDIIAKRGTPIVANVSGAYSRSTNRQGGVSYHLSGDDGVRYYGTHLEGYSGVPSGRVTVGTVIGYVGNSGNARGGITHLHFEIHPGGGAAVNPYPTLARHC